MNNWKIEKIKDVEIKLNVIHKQILELKSYLDKKHGKGEAEYLRNEAEYLRNLIKLYEKETAIQKELNNTKKEIEYKELYNEIINSTVPTIDQLQRLLVLKAETLTDEYPRLSKDLATKIQFNHYKDIWEILNDKDIKELLEEKDIKLILDKVIAYVENDRALHKKYIFPKEYTVPNDKITNSLMAGNPKDFNGQVNFNIGTRERNAIIPTEITMPDDLLQTSGFNLVDQLIYGAICSIYEAGNRRFTLDQVYRMAIVSNNSQTTTASNLEVVNNSIRKMRTTLIKIDAREGMLFYKNPNMPQLYSNNEIEVKKANTILKELKTERPLLDLNHTEAVYENKHGEFTVTEYQIRTEPILYQHAKIPNHRITKNIKALESKSKDLEQASFTLHVLKQLNIAKGKRKNEWNLLLNSLIKVAKPEENPRTYRKRYIRKLRNVLDNMEKSKEIKGYSEIKEGNKLRGFKLYL